jgi:hypothetical protein
VLAAVQALSEECGMYEAHLAALQERKEQLAEGKEQLMAAARRRALLASLELGRTSGRGTMAA